MVSMLVLGRMVLFGFSRLVLLTSFVGGRTKSIVLSAALLERSLGEDDNGFCRAVREHNDLLGKRGTKLHPP